jgi:hypothetical protein
VNKEALVIEGFFSVSKEGTHMRQKAIAEMTKKAVEEIGQELEQEIAKLAGLPASAKKEKPHGRNCDCASCAEARVEEKVQLWKHHGAAAPVDPDKTVFVRSFWRKQKNHMRQMPNTRLILVSKLRALARIKKG